MLAEDFMLFNRNGIRNHNCFHSGLRIFIFVVFRKVFIKISYIGG